MDMAVEGLLLGVDAFLFAICMRQYYKNKNAAIMVERASYLPINNDLEETVKSYSDQKVPYVTITGVVQPLGKPLISTNNPNVRGVVQLLTITEHFTHRNSAGFWGSATRSLQEVNNVMPFAISNKGVLVEITDPLAADVLDMDVISDVFSPSKLSLTEQILGFFVGIRQKGLQSTERMVREGTTMTGIGELVYSESSNGIILQPPSSGAPFYLTTMQTTALVKKLNTFTTKYKLLCMLFGTLSLVISGIILKKYLKHKNELLEEARRRALRKERRKLQRTLDVPEHKQCVACKTNPIEIILLPCGHVCLCEDCLIRVQETNGQCPLCRNSIERHSVAFMP